MKDGFADLEHLTESPSIRNVIRITIQRIDGNNTLENGSIPFASEWHGGKTPLPAQDSGEISHE